MLLVGLVGLVGLIYLLVVCLPTINHTAFAALACSVILELVKLLKSAPETGFFCVQARQGQEALGRIR